MPSAGHLRRKCPRQHSQTDANEPLPPLHGYIESMQVNGKHVPNLVVSEMADDDQPVRFLDETCLRDFVYWLDTLILDGTQPLTVLAHNFQGYESYPVVDELHRQKRKLEQIRNGGKMLQLTYDVEGATVRFIDLMSLFGMPLLKSRKRSG